MKKMKKIISVLLACLLCLSIGMTCAFAANYIGEAKAKEIAFGKAGITAEQARFVTCEFDYDDGVAVYEVEFFFDSVEYSCDINAKTGKVIKFEIDTVVNPLPDTDANYIGKAKAKQPPETCASGHTRAVTPQNALFRRAAASRKNTSRTNGHSPQRTKKQAHTISTQGTLRTPPLNTFKSDMRSRKFPCYARLSCTAVPNMLSEV